jgi:hypothetical protein
MLLKIAAITAEFLLPIRDNHRARTDGLTLTACGLLLIRRTTRQAVDAASRINTVAVINVPGLIYTSAPDWCIVESDVSVIRTASGTGDND